MDLLFKDNSEANTELKDLLGFVHADIKYDNIKPDIISATRDLIKIIGKDVYDLCLLHYNLDPSVTADNEFVRMVRYPIAIGAYMVYAPQNDLAHTNNGRKMKADDSEKSPFEWMLERSDNNLERKYYKTIDELIDFLDEQEVPVVVEGESEPISIAATWRESDAFKKSQKLFVRTTEEFDEFFPLQSKLLLMKLGPGIAQCESRHIKPLITANKYNELKEVLSTSGSISEADEGLLQLIKKACVYYAMAWAMPRFSVNMYPEGVLQHYTSDRITVNGKQPTLKSETQEARQAFEKDLELALNEIESYLAPAVELDSDAEFDVLQYLGSTRKDDNFFTT